MHFVYILKSLSDGKHYTGCSTDLERRIAEHNVGKTSLLKGRRPLVLLYSEIYDSQEAAYKREKQIKAYKGGAAFKKLIRGGVA